MSGIGHHPHTIYKYLLNVAKLSNTGFEIILFSSECTHNFYRVWFACVFFDTFFSERKKWE